MSAPEQIGPDTLFKIRDCYKYYTSTVSGFLLRSLNKYTMLEGEKVTDVLLPLVNFLNMPGKLSDAASVCDLELEDAVDLLAVLEEQQIVVRDPPSIEENMSSFYSQICYFSEFVPNGVRCQQMLADSHIAVIGLNAVGSNLSRVLVESGVNNISLIDSEIVGAEDIQTGQTYSDKDIGKSRARVLSETLAYNREHLKVRPIHMDDCTYEEFSRVLSDEFSLVVSCVDDEKTLLVLNLACAARLVRWISVRIDGLSGLLGPMVTPGQSPCYECWRLWRLANETQLDYQLLIDTGSSFIGRPNFTTAVPVAWGLASIAATEIINLVTRFSMPNTHGHVMDIRLDQMSIESHRIMQIPRCSVCSLGRNSSMATLLR